LAQIEAANRAPFLEMLERLARALTGKVAELAE
jgi:type IV secretory pathway VirB2 component (pilin)